MIKIPDLFSVKTALLRGLFVIALTLGVLLPGSGQAEPSRPPQNYSQNQKERGPIPDANIPDATLGKLSPRHKGKSNIPEEILSLQKCRKFNSYFLLPAYINLQKTTEVKGKSKIKGQIEGNCLAEAGYYEDGERVSILAIKPQTTYGKFPFEVTLNKTKQCEIRVITANGSRAIKVLHERR